MKNLTKTLAILLIALFSISLISCEKEPLEENKIEYVEEIPDDLEVYTVDFKIYGDGGGYADISITDNDSILTTTRYWTWDFPFSIELNSKDFLHCTIMMVNINHNESGTNVKATIEYFLNNKIKHRWYSNTDDAPDELRVYFELSNIYEENL